MSCNKYLENEMQMETKTDEKEDDQTGFVSDKAKCRHAFLSFVFEGVRVEI